MRPEIDEASLAKRKGTIMKATKFGESISATMMACAFAVGCFGAAGTAALTAAPEASASIVNSKVMTAYKGKVKELKKDCRADSNVRVGYADLDGNGVKELICTYKPRNVLNSPDRQIIYTYKDKRVKCLFDYLGIPSYKLTYSQKSNSFSAPCLVKGQKRTTYYKLKNGKYHETASKYYSVETGKWHYSVTKGSKSKAVKKATFAKKISSLQKGKLHKVVLK